MSLTQGKQGHRKIRKDDIWDLKFHAECAKIDYAKNAKEDMFSNVPYSFNQSLILPLKHSLISILDSNLPLYLSMP